MEHNILGRTGLRVSVAGLGCGGHSCLGQKRKASREESTRLVRGALDLAVNEITCRLMRQGRPSGDGTVLDFLIHETGASSLVDAAYRYARHEPGNDVVLFGTGNRDHLLANINALLKPPLPADDRRKIEELFGTLEGVGLTKNPSFRPLPREL